MAHNGHRIVVVMDEFQKIRKLSKFGLETLIHSRIQLQHNTNCLFMGGKTHIIQDMITNKNQPFNNSAVTLQISTLPQRDSIDLSPIGTIHAVSEDLCHYLIALVENIPYYIHSCPLKCGNI